MRKRALMVMMGLCMCVSLTACGRDIGKKEETTQKTTEAEMKMLKEYKKVDITKASKLNQVSKPEKGETIAIVKVKGYGEMKFKFFSQDSPLAVENFLTLAFNKYYNGIKFHRVIKDFMIQGGDPDGTGAGGNSIWGQPFKNENSNTLLPIYGALCMANAGRDTNGSQFFIVQNKIAGEMEYGGKTPTEKQKKIFDQYGGYPYLMDDYTVFGQLYEGADVLDAIASTKTDKQDAPVDDVVIESIKVTKAK